MNTRSRNMLRASAILLSTFLILLNVPMAARADTTLGVTIDHPINGLSSSGLVFYRFNGQMTVDGIAVRALVGATITCRIQRDCDGSFWDGSNWGNSPRDLYTDVTNFLNERPWSCVAPLPAAASVPEGSYTCTAHASEGLSSDNATSHVLVDATSPVLQLNTPVDGSAGRIFPVIAGTAVDPPGLDACGNAAPASGVPSVALAISRWSDGAGWDGSNWVNDVLTYVQAPVDPSNGTWAYALPNGAATDGLYYIDASCGDRAGNWTLPSAHTRSIWVDTRPPGSPTFGFPSNGGTVPGLPRISGGAADNVGGSGIDRVLVTLQRASDSSFWDGTGWTSETYFPTTWSFVPTPVGFAPRISWEADNVWPGAAALANGTYRVRAYAYDLAGNSTAATNTFTVNKQSPTLSFTSPANGAALNAFPSIYGTATAAPGLSIARVDLYLYKSGWQAYWDGTIWDDQNTTVFHTEMTGPTTWYYTNSLPSGPDAADDTYSLIAYAYDTAGNSSPLVIYFSIDGTNPPPPTIDSPAYGAPVRALPLIRGTGTDNPGGSGFQSVLIFLSRNSDGKYWNGSSWDVFSFASILGASASGTNWVRNYSLPAAGNLAEGSYSIVARSFDWAGNEGDIRSSSFTVDLTAPVVTFLAPSPTIPAATLPAVSGTASDLGGSGLQRLDLAIQRGSDSYFWNGSEWTSLLTTLPTVLQGNSWSISVGLPGGANLDEGPYALFAYAYDQAGNLGRFELTTTIQRPLLTVTATGVDKIYDGNTMATVMLSDNRAAGDVFSVNYSSALFDTKNVGLNKAVIVSGISITGPDAAKYDVNAAAATSANITVRPIIVTAVSDSRIYDGTSGSAVAPTVTAGSLASVDAAAWTQTFDNKNVGTGKALLPAGFVTDGNGGGNYTVTFAPNNTGVITPLVIAGLITAADKVYDGTTAADITGRNLSGVLGGDAVSLAGGAASFADKNVGTHTVTGSGLTLIGTDAGNYTLNSTAATTATITPAKLTIKAQDQLRVYSAPNPSFTADYSGWVAGESATVLSGTPDLSTLADVSSPVGTYAIAAMAGSLSAPNYTLAFVDGTLTINPASSLTTLSSSYTPSPVHSNVTFTATVTAGSPATGLPTGNLLFLLNGVALASPVPLTQGVASIDTVVMPSGSNTVMATYAGDGNFLGSSNSVVQVVSDYVAPVVIGIRNNPGSTVTLTFTGTPGAQYLVQATSDLSSQTLWKNAATNIAGTSGQWTFTDSVPHSVQRFYRIRLP